MSPLKIRGVIVPMLTALSDEGKIDERRTEALINFLITREVAGLFPLGTTGEGPLLSVDERCQVASWIVKHSNGRVPVIIHTGSITTADTITLTRHARDCGADAAAIVPPYFYKLSSEAVFEHFAAVIEAVGDFPIYLYNNPGVTPNALTYEMVSNLAEAYKTVVGLKDSGGALDMLFKCRSLHEGRFNTASGPDGLIMAAQTIGIDACVSGNANFVPELVVAVVNAAQRGELEAARHYQAQLDQVRSLLGDGADLSLFKAICAKRGIPVGDARKPLRSASREKIEACWQVIQEIGVIPVSAS